LQPTGGKGKGPGGDEQPKGGATREVAQSIARSTDRVAGGSEDVCTTAEANGYLSTNDREAVSEQITRTNAGCTIPHHPVVSEKSPWAAQRKRRNPEHEKRRKLVANKKRRKLVTERRRLENARSY